MKQIFSILLSVVQCIALSVSTFGIEGQTVQVNQLNGWIVIDGVKAYPRLDERNARSPIIYNGTAYIPLLAAEQWLGADVVYEEKSKTITITSNGTQQTCYTRDDPLREGMVWDDWEGLDGSPTTYQNAQLRNDVAIIVDGQEKHFEDATGTEIYPLQFQGYILLPLDVVSELSGKLMVKSLHDFSTFIHLCDAPVQTELAEATDYLATIRTHINAVQEMVEQERPATEEAFIEALREAQGHISAVWTLPTPAFKGMTQHVEELRECAELVLWENIDPYLPAEENSGASPAGCSPKTRIVWEAAKNGNGGTAYFPNTNMTIAFDLERDWNSFTRGMIRSAEETADNVTTHFLELEKLCTAGEKFLAEIAQEMGAAAY